MRRRRTINAKTKITQEAEERNCEIAHAGIAEGTIMLKKIAIHLKIAMDSVNTTQMEEKRRSHLSLAFTARGITGARIVPIKETLNLRTGFKMETNNTMSRTCTKKRYI
jgi:hypothetical protein